MDANQFYINEGSPSKLFNNATLWRGQKDLMNMEEDTIMSGKGTVRGVKNRVRAGIATFLQDQSKKVITTV
jgi:hypothetical protein